MANTTNKQKPVSNSVRKYRKLRGMSQLDLAKEARLSKQMISGIETGRYGLSQSSARMISKVLGCTVRQLYETDTEETDNVDNYFKLNMHDVMALYGRTENFTEALNEFLNGFAVSSKTIQERVLYQIIDQLVKVIDVCTSEDMCDIQRAVNRVCTDKDLSYKRACRLFGEEEG